ncbi:hypothetical protein POTOM_000589 [Populus tomentosa]|uniref:BZIP domain-containing protein n=2 Tax=Populus TaxID=3689 RepID=A0A8X8DGF3_POPTO|nr:hypothetical protein POTOM_000589 [Populus tomentosa]
MNGTSRDDLTARWMSSPRLTKGILVSLFHMFYKFEGCRAISLDFTRHDHTTFSSFFRRLAHELQLLFFFSRKPAMDHESPWQHLLEASLPPPAPEFEAYNGKCISSIYPQRFISFHLCFRKPIDPFQLEYLDLGGAPYSSLTEFETDQKARGIQQAFNYFSAARPGSSHQSSNITDTDKKGQDLEATKDQVAKKRKIDRAYRERCKRNKIETERNLDLRRKENDRLKGENAFFKTEAVRTRQTLQSQEQEMKRVRKTIVLLEEKRDKQNTVVEVLSKRLAGANDTDLQRENTQLKNKILLLMSQVNDQNSLDKLQLQEKNAQLEHDKSSLEVIVQALCEMINNEKGHEETVHLE